MSVVTGRGGWRCRWLQVGGVAMLVVTGRGVAMSVVTGRGGGDVGGYR